MAPTANTFRSAFLARHPEFALADVFGNVDYTFGSAGEANRTGGLSGPAVKPVAVRMVYQVAQAVKLPIIGMGGIMNADDAIEFILAGASAVAVGTANFHNPYATEEIVKGIDAYMAKYGIEDIHELIGAVR